MSGKGASACFHIAGGMMMLKFANRKIDISLLSVISFLGVMGLVSNVASDEASNTETKVVFNSMESFQINCFAADNGIQQAPDPEHTERIVKLAASGEPEQRVSALSQLAVKGRVDAGVVQKILQAGILDKDPNVRGQAIYAIARQECNDVLLVLEQAMQDSELSVRMMAIDSLGTDGRSIVLLEQALDDEEEAIRELAAMKLESLFDADKARDGDNKESAGIIN